MLNWATFIGAPDATYNVSRSRLPAPHAGCVLENITISGGKFLSIGVSIGIGQKDSPVHVSPDGYVQKLKWISEKFVVLWDEQFKRGWLVNGTSALLHLLRQSLESNRTDKFKSAFLFKPELIKESPSPHTADAAIEFFLNDTNMKLEIYAEKGEMYDEETVGDASQSGNLFKRKRTYFRVEDRVEHLCDILEHIFLHQIDIAGQNGVKLKLQARKLLEGWDFKNLAIDQGPFFPCVATLQAFGNGWVDFTRSVHAVTLIGRGFGEIIRPEYPSSLCTRWAELPIGNYYLAACVSTLRDIMELYGDEGANPMRLSENIIWHNPTKVFEACRCKKKFGEAHSDIVQILWPSMLAHILPKKNPVPLGDHGAVIFGHNSYFNWQWKDTGNPVKGGPPLPMEESEIQFHDSALGLSEGTSPGRENEDIAALGSQPSGYGSSSEPLPHTTVSESTSFYGIGQPTASVEASEQRELTLARQDDQRKKSTLAPGMFRSLMGRLSKH